MSNSGSVKIESTYPGKTEIDSRRIMRERGGNEGKGTGRSSGDQRMKLDGQGGGDSERRRGRRRKLREYSPESWVRRLSETNGEPDLFKEK